MVMAVSTSAAAGRVAEVFALERPAALLARSKKYVISVSVVLG